MLRFLSQIFCNHKPITRNRDGRWFTECRKCLKESHGITEKPWLNRSLQK